MGPLSRWRERVGVRVVGQQPAPDDLKHSLRLLQHLQVIESQNSKAGCLQARSAPQISSLGRRLEVLASIEFDHQVCFQARKVSNERADGALAAELAALQTPVAQVVPQQAFGVG